MAIRIRHGPGAGVLAEFAYQTGVRGGKLERQRERRAEERGRRDLLARIRQRDREAEATRAQRDREARAARAQQLEMEERRQTGRRELLAERVGAQRELAEEAWERGHPEADTPEFERLQAPAVAAEDRLSKRKREELKNKLETVDKLRASGKYSEKELDFVEAQLATGLPAGTLERLREEEPETAEWWETKTIGDTIVAKDPETGKPVAVGKVPPPPKEPEKPTKGERLIELRRQYKPTTVVKTVDGTPVKWGELSADAQHERVLKDSEAEERLLREGELELATEEDLEEAYEAVGDDKAAITQYLLERGKVSAP